MSLWIHFVGRERKGPGLDKHQIDSERSYGDARDSCDRGGGSVIPVAADLRQRVLASKDATRTIRAEGGGGWQHRGRCALR